MTDVDVRVRVCVRVGVAVKNADSVQALSKQVSERA
jgi:hypothetical protein